MQDLVQQKNILTTYQTPICYMVTPPVLVSTTLHFEREWHRTGAPVFFQLASYFKNGQVITMYLDAYKKVKIMYKNACKKLIYTHQSTYSDDLR